MTQKLIFNMLGHSDTSVNMGIIVLGNGSSHIQHPSCTNADLLVIWPQRTDFNAIWSKAQE